MPVVRDSRRTRRDKKGRGNLIMAMHWQGRGFDGANRENLHVHTVAHIISRQYLIA